MKRRDILEMSYSNNLLLTALTWFSAGVTISTITEPCAPELTLITVIRAMCWCV